MGKQGYLGASGLTILRWLQKVDAPFFFNRCPFHPVSQRLCLSLLPHPFLQRQFIASLPYFKSILLARE
jgi:hypothetical protein